MKGRSLLKRKAQSTAEYAILIGLVVAVAIAMQTYVKRGMQGRLHDASDKFYDDLIGDTNWSSVTDTIVTPSTTKQFEHTKLTSQATQNTLENTETSTMATAGKVTRESTRRTEQAVGDFQKYDRY